MTIDIIITTYKRPHQVVQLVQNILSGPKKPNGIIVVDSSDELNTELVNLGSVRYIRSHYKNQPYQRYLGFLSAQSEYVLYLDDDMEIADDQYLSMIENTFQKKETSGIAIRFKDKTSATSLESIPKSTLTVQGLTKRIINTLTGYPQPGIGQLGLCGAKGPQPAEGGLTEWVSGGAFAAKKADLFKNLNFQLFELFEQKLGMGEDTLIGYGLHKQGGVYYISQQLFWHNEISKSNYASNFESFSKRVLYSRLYLSLEKCRLDNSPLWKAYLHYHWYALWRILGLAINVCIHPNQKRLSMVKGALKGYLLTFKLNYRYLPSCTLR